MYGHHYLNVTDGGAHRRFFVDTLGGVAVGATPDTIVRFPNAMIFLREQAPTGGTKGTTVNHFAFGVPDIRRMVDRVKLAGWPMVTRAETPATQEVRDDLAFMVDQQTDIAFTRAPDETKAWYVKVFGARPGKRGNFEAADMPGVNLTYSPSPVPVVGTRGRALDHIGFEIKDLEAFCGALEASGVTLDRPYTVEKDLNVGTAFLTDPWGTYIGLTEGLDKVS